MAQFTKYTGTVSGQVGSLITALDAILVTGQSWTKAFTGTNKAVYRAPVGNRLYLRVNDNGAGTGGAREALMRGFEAMTTVDAGTGPFPTAAQSALTENSIPLRKSSSLDGVARSYVAFADQRTLYWFCNTGETYWYTFAFGEFYSLVPGDQWNTMIIGRNAENGNYTVETLFHNTLNTSNSSYHFMARSYTGLTGSINFGVDCDQGKGINGTAAGSVPFPNPCDGGLYLSPMWVHDKDTSPANHMRGRLRGLWIPAHPVGSFDDAQSVIGVGDLSGKTFFTMKQVVSSSVPGVGFVETSDTLETN